MTNKNERSGTVSDWMVERLAAGELSPARADEITRRLAAEPGGAERLSRIADSNAALLAAHPPANVAAEIQRRVAHAAAANGVRAPRTWFLTLGAPAVAVAAVMLALLVSPRWGWGPQVLVGAGSAGPSEDGERIKGLHPSLRVYRKVGDTAERLPAGARTRAGDRLQLAYVAAGQHFGAVLSVDGSGHVTFHLPAAGGLAARLRTDGEVALADAYELDAAPGFERFVFISSNALFDTASLAEVVRGAAVAPAGTFSVSFTVRKE